MKAKPSIKYIPINCNFYDHFEAAITLTKTVTIRYYDTDRKVKEVIMKPVDLIQKKGEEFLLLENETMIRLDYIISFGNHHNPSTSCTYNSYILSEI